jgi:hypothetical protein
VSLMTRGIAALVRRQQQAAVSGNPVTYSRGAETVDLTNKAWTGRTLFAREPKEAGGATVVWGERDYLVPAADLVLNGRATEPARGDRVTETVGGVALVFEVMALPGEPEWRYADANRSVYRLHCKRVG